VPESSLLKFLPSSILLGLFIFYPFPLEAKIYLAQTDTGSVTLTDRSEEVDVYDTFVLLIDRQDLRRETNPERLQEIVGTAARKHELPEALIYAVIQVESAGDSTVESEEGAVGLMQLMPRTARYLGVENPYDPKENILGGTLYLRRLMDRFKGDLDRVLAAYNAGPSTVEDHGGVPPYRETRQFVRRVRDRFEDLKAERDMIYTYRDENGVLHVTNIR